eukprot:TRINITY_DN1845_c0_g1_i1.p1 TRINITY_DN1845_c0_g1~~TRINITY_DN1845_c0_g1_i1.p1  ORF type:complete len:762 (+),score=235.29 TRINITY_DN1845_c0_g1_i1:30-2315(+)
MAFPMASVLARHARTAAIANARLLHQGSSRLAEAAATATKNVSYTIDSEGIATVVFDQQGSKVNTLSMEMSDEFEKVMTALESNPQVRAAVLMSGKPDSFIAGADINMLAKCKSADELAGISKSAQDMFAKFANGKPKVAAIHGTCLGGGLELALACDYRIATEHPKTQLGLPEVQLGLLPGAGGTQRLPPLVGLQAALPMLLTGSNTRPAKAKKIKLVDSLADPNALHHAAVQAAKGLADGSLRVNREPKGLAKLMRYVLEDTEFGRNFVFKKAREQVMKQSKGNYPAPLKILDVVEESAAAGFGSTAGYTAESKGFGDLGMTPESKACISIYFGQTACKKNPFKPSRTDEKVGVLGAGLMGAGIAEVTIAKAGKDAVMKDAKAEGLARGINQIYKNFDKKVKKRRMAAFERDQTVAKLMPVSDADGNWQQHFKNVDMIIEAVFENIDLKHKVIKEYEAITPDHCVFATNTSAIPIGQLAQASKRPDKFVGMHYFSPVDKMPLLEIIRHEGTSDDTVGRAYAMGLKQGKTPIIVKDVPGFYINRSLGPFMDEGMALLLDGAKISQVDKALTTWGFPVGPMTLIDEVGLDVANNVAKFLATDLGNRVGTADPELLDRVIAKGWLGRKSGTGMHIFPKKGKKTVNAEMEAMIEEVRKQRNKPSSEFLSEEDLQMRMVTRFVNETSLCLQDSIITDPVAGDIGAIFGIGFAPFRGGPFRFIDAYGVSKLVDQMHRYRDVLGDQFEPCQLLKDYAKDNKKFHQD